MLCFLCFFTLHTTPYLHTLAASHPISCASRLSLQRLVAGSQRRFASQGGGNSGRNRRDARQPTLNLPEL